MIARFVEKVTQAYKVMGQIKPYIFSTENTKYIIEGVVLTAANIGLNLATPNVLSSAYTSLSTGEATAFLGVEISPLAMVGLYGLTWTASNLMSTFSTLALTPIGSNATKKLADDYVDKQMQQSLAYHQSTSMGHHNNLISKIYMGVPSLSTNLFSRIIPTPVEIVVVAAYFSRLYGYQWGLSLIGLLGTTAVYNVMTNKTITEVREEMVTKGFELYEKMTHALENYETISISDKHLYELGVVQDSSKEYADIESQANAVVSKIDAGQGLISGIGFTGLCMLAAKGVVDGKYSVSDFILISAYLAQFSTPLNAFANSVNQMVVAFVELQAVFDELVIPSSVVDRYPNKKLNVERSNATIEFKDVGFYYEDKEDKPILKSISFKIEAGQKIGIVGTSGAGKSTIANLLLRFYDSTSGKILINGQDIKEVSLSSLRSAVGVVPQSTVLNNDSLFKNIAYGVQGQPKDVKVDQVMNAVKAAELTQYVDSLTDKLETEVGEKGAKMSGGQRQRVAIARAVIKEPKIFILDEATSALDAKTERLIQGNLDEISQGVTTLVITHELANLINADKIIVLDKGSIVEQGTHGELLKNEGVYAGLWREAHEAVESVQSGMSIVEIDEKQSDAVVHRVVTQHVDDKTQPAVLVPQVANQKVEVKAPQPATLVPQIVIQKVEAKAQPASTPGHGPSPAHAEMEKLKKAVLAQPKLSASPAAMFFGTVANDVKIDIKPEPKLAPLSVEGRAPSVKPQSSHCVIL
jgi:ABC-type transport system involved in Fe-S cluster assembly fused permease/ATPase subunit